MHTDSAAPAPSVADVRAGFAPTLVCANAILTNGPTLDDLARLAVDLDGFADELVGAAAAHGETLPEPLVASLEVALDSVAFVVTGTPPA